MMLNWACSDWILHIEDARSFLIGCLGTLPMGHFGYFGSDKRLSAILSSSLLSLPSDSTEICSKEYRSSHRKPLLWLSDGALLKRFLSKYYNFQADDWHTFKLLTLQNWCTSYSFDGRTPISDYFSEDWPLRKDFCDPFCFTGIDKKNLS